MNTQLKSGDLIIIKTIFETYSLCFFNTPVIYLGLSKMQFALDRNIDVLCKEGVKSVYVSYSDQITILASVNEFSLH